MADKKVNVNRKYKSPKGVLRSVKRLFEESPSNWTRYMLRRTRKTANGGYAFCAVGAINHFAATPTAAEGARELLRNALPDNCIEAANDNRGRNAILAALDKVVVSDVQAQR